MLKVVNLTKTFQDNKVIDDLSISFDRTGMYFILGKSGTGKSTLLSILSGLAKPTSGNIYFENNLIDFDDPHHLNEYRRNHVSFVFQDFNIIDEMTVKENLLLLGNEGEISEIIEKVGMSNHINQKCISLSGGEKQRVAIARSLLKKSDILFFDEPTGNLDIYNSLSIYKIIQSISKEKLCIVVSHDNENARKFSDKIIYLRNNKRVKQLDNKSISIFIEDDNYYYDYVKVVNFLNTSQANIIGFDYTIDNVSTRCQVSKKDIAKEINSIFSRNFNKNIIFKFNEDNETITTKLNRFNNDINNFVNFKFILKYTITMLFTSRRRILLSIISLSISLAILFLSANFFFFNDDNTLGNIMEQKEENLPPVFYEECNYLINQCYNYKVGKSIYQKMSLFNVNNEIISYEMYNDNSNVYYLNYIDSIHLIDFLELDLTSLKKNEIIISDFISEIYFGMNRDEISNTSISIGDYDNLFVVGVYETNYKERNIHFYSQTPSFNEDYKDDLFAEYGNIYTSTETKENDLANHGYLDLYASDFTKSQDTFNNYVNTLKRYSSINSNLDDISLIAGELPNDDNEIIVSESFYNLSLKGNLIESENFNPIYYEYKDIRESINFSSYHEILNIFETTQSIKVVGIYSDLSNQIEILVNDVMYENLITEYSYYSVDGYRIKVNGDYKGFMSNISSANLRIDYDYSREIYEIDNFIWGEFNQFIILFNIILVALSATLFNMFVTASIKERTNDIAIFKTLGLRDTKIIKVFLPINILCLIIYIIMSLISGMLIVYYLNERLAISMNINYHIFNYELFSYFLILILSLIIFSYSFLMTVQRIVKLDPWLMFRQTEQ